MKIETLQKSHLKRDIIIGVITVLIISAVILNFTRAKYRTTQSIPLVNGTINYKPYDFKMIAMYQENDDGEYEEIDVMPSSGYTINEEMSYCTVDNLDKDTEAKLYTNSNDEHVIANLQKGSKCYLYFDKKILLMDAILSAKDIQTRNDFSIVMTEDTTGTIFKGEDDDGVTYYFAGKTNDNYIIFGGFYWRIIRINGDGSIRLIYNGTSSAQIGVTTQIGTSAFKDPYDNISYVGYMYQIGNSHGFEEDSDIKRVVDNWYINNLQIYSNNIDLNAGFCNDREFSSASTSQYEYFAGHERLRDKKSPSFKCSNTKDLFTAKESNKGNKALTYPIGLITADEVAFAGGINSAYGSNINRDYYLHTEQSYWTMTPWHYNINSNYVTLFYVGAPGYLSNPSADTECGVRPVINLKADVTISGGDGSASNPYVIE